MIRRTLVLLLCCAGTAGLFAQTERSIDGRKYTVHVVQAGQTLYAIARVYGAPVEAIIAANPASADGLSIGEEVLVPHDAVVKRALRSAPELRADGELVHKVRRKETLYSIARSYGVDINALAERNPGSIDLKEGMDLVIPVQRVIGTPGSALMPALPPGMRSHLVKPGETLFSLGQLYHLDPAVIREANGGLVSGLRAGEHVLIPGTAAPSDAGEAAEHKADKRYSVAMFLPFAIDRNDSVLERTTVEDAPLYYEPTRIAVQFYNGARMAIDSLERLGLKADISVVDLGDDIKSWNTVIKRPATQDHDLFIGPFHRTAIEQLARVNQRAHIVCPVPQSNKVILGMPNVSKVTPTRSDLVKHAARYVADRHAMDHIILARPDIATEKEVQEQARTALNEALSLRSARLRDTVIVAKPGKRDVSDLTNKLSNTHLNVVVVPSEDVEFVTTLVGRLKALATKHRILLVGMESWTEIPSLAASDLDLLGFSFAASSFRDPKDPRLQAFTRAYRDRFVADVDGYALLGFDVTFYYLMALHTYGIGFMDHFAEVHTTPLHMGFRMTRTGPENGFRNEHAIMLRQQDLQLIKAP